MTPRTGLAEPAIEPVMLEEGVSDADVLDLIRKNIDLAYQAGGDRHPTHLSANVVDWLWQEHARLKSAAILRAVPGEEEIARAMAEARVPGSTTPGGQYDRDSSWRAVLTFDARAVLALLAGQPVQDETEAVRLAVEAEREGCARVAEEYPATVTVMWDRPGGPPGNGVRPSTRVDIAAAIRSRAASTTRGAERDDGR